MKVLILGANGFIGSNLSEAILLNTDWQIFAMDMAQDKLEKCLEHTHFHFTSGDITQQKNWVRWAGSRSNLSTRHYHHWLAAIWKTVVGFCLVYSYC